MIATIPSATVLGVEGRVISVEVHVSNGLPAFNIVGLPDSACREARDRVRSALLSSGLSWPSRRVTVNLAPSAVRKIGTCLDLPILVGVLVATEAIPAACVEGMAFVGELGLDGSVRSVNGVVPLVETVQEAVVIVPTSAVPQALLVNRHRVLGVESVKTLVAALQGAQPWPPAPAEKPNISPPLVSEDLADVRGQPFARWAVEIAAAGGHNLLLCGPPGSGKSMLARRLPGLLPDLDPDVALACTRIHSAAGTLDNSAQLITRPLLRAPHHTASVVSMVGGGAAAMRPGEISLAHGGVLFLDEMGEFPRSVLEALRQPLESGEVTVNRAAGTVRFPSRFQVVGATNPCPCGEGELSPACRCSEAALVRYRSKISSALLDRFDIRVEVRRPSAEQFLSAQPSEKTEVVAERVRLARARARTRGVRHNSELDGEDLRKSAPLDRAANSLLRRWLERGVITGRGLNRVRKVALTVSDLEDADLPLTENHVASALQLHAQPTLALASAS